MVHRFNALTNNNSLETSARVDGRRRKVEPDVRRLRASADLITSRRASGWSGTVISSDSTGHGAAPDSPRTQRRPVPPNLPNCVICSLACSCADGTTPTISCTLPLANTAAIQSPALPLPKTRIISSEERGRYWSERHHGRAFDAQWLLRLRINIWGLHASHFHYCDRNGDAGNPAWL